MQAAGEAARGGDNSAVVCSPSAPILHGAASTPSATTPAPSKSSWQPWMDGWTTTVKTEDGKRSGRRPSRKDIDGNMITVAPVPIL